MPGIDGSVARLRFGLGAIAITLLCALTSFAQSLPPGVPSNRARIRINGTSCPAKSEYRWYFPLGEEKADPECFYEMSEWIEPLSQVKFLYGFGQDTKSISADLTSIVFPFGLQAAGGTSVTAASGDPNGTKDTPQQAIERLKTGGDFYVRFAYPFFYVDRGAFTGIILGAPKLGFPSPDLALREQSLRQTNTTSIRRSKAMASTAR
jgi:hypothetical protein